MKNKKYILVFLLVITVALIFFKLIEPTEIKIIPVPDLSQTVNIFLQTNDTLYFEQPENQLTFSYLYYNKYRDLLYIRDGIYHRVGIYNKQGELLRVFGGEGQGPEQFNILNGIEFDSSGDILASDGGFRRITKFDYRGNFKEIVYIFDRSNFPNDAKLSFSNDSTIIVGVMDPISFYSDNFTQSFIFCSFHYPSWTKLNQGGYLMDIYKENISFLLGRDIIYSHGAYYFTQWASPLITCLNHDLSTRYYIENNGEHFIPITEGFKGKVGFQTFHKMARFTDGKSIMHTIFNLNNSIVVVYYNVFRQEQLGRLLYQNSNGKENEYWYQVYSPRMEKYFGEFYLPGKYLGNDGINIYTKITTGHIEKILRSSFSMSDKVEK